MLNTASAAIGFARKLEEDSARLYEALSRKFPQDKEVFLSFIKENQKNTAQIERAYYEVITDALEGCFAFSLNLDEYVFDTELPEKTGYAEALGRAIRMEEKIRQFYAQAAEQSKSLMADVPRAFALVARKKESRLATLKLLLNRKV